ncbi:hypothetical protein NitYY0918_C1699 [Nitratiruptor sp. YY09-18]|nr:hypothetical protein NitYY0918_C1699 [Nitratiruptor sp. YY09-18]
MALLHALGVKKLRLNPISPTFFANIAKILGIESEYVDTRLDFGSEADIVHNFFESYTPSSLIVFQNHGKSVGDAKVFVKKSEGCLVAEFEDEELYQKTKLFLDGGVKRGRLWNYDVVSVGIKEKAKECEVAGLEEKIARSNEIVEFFDERFAKNPYFDTLCIGKATYKTYYPILLKPALYCPKEDIYQELRENGIAVEVRFKPLYKLTFFHSASMPVSEELYKAIMLLPLDKNIVEPLWEVLEKYRYRGCSF